MEKTRNSIGCLYYLIIYKILPACKSTLQLCQNVFKKPNTRTECVWENEIPIRLYIQLLYMFSVCLGKIKNNSGRLRCRDMADLLTCLRESASSIGNIYNFKQIILPGETCSGWKRMSTCAQR